MDWISNNNWVILLIIVVFVGLIGGISYLIYRILNKNKGNEKPTDEEIAKENIDRFLEDIEDPIQEKQFDDYEKSNEDKEKEDK